MVCTSLVTVDKIKPIRKRTPYIVEVPSCCEAALLPVVLEVLNVSKVGRDQRDILEQDVQPTVRNLGKRSFSSFLSAGQGPKAHIQQHRRLAEKEKMRLLNWPAVNPKLNPKLTEMEK